MSSSGFQKYQPKVTRMIQALEALDITAVRALFKEEEDAPAAYARGMAALRKFNTEQEIESTVAVGTPDNKLTSAASFGSIHDPLPRGYEGQTFLHILLSVQAKGKEQTKLDILQLLLAKKINDRYNDNGYSALVLAGLSGCLDIVEHLLSNPQPYQQSGLLNNALQRAVQAFPKINTFAFITQLLLAGADANVALRAINSTANFADVAKLIEHICNPQQTPPRSRTNSIASNGSDSSSTSNARDKELKEVNSPSNGTKDAKDSKESKAAQEHGHGSNEVKSEQAKRPSFNTGLLNDRLKQAINNIKDKKLSFKLCRILIQAGAERDVALDHARIWIETVIQENGSQISSYIELISMLCNLDVTSSQHYLANVNFQVISNDTLQKLMIVAGKLGNETMMMTLFTKGGLFKDALHGVVSSKASFSKNVGFLATIRTRCTGDILKSFAEIDLQKDLQTGVGFAIECESLDAIKNLINLGADPQIIFDTAMNTLQNKATSYLQKVIALLLQNQKPIIISDEAMGIAGALHDVALLKSFMAKGGNKEAALMPALNAFKIGHKEANLHAVMKLLCQGAVVSSEAKDAKEHKAGDLISAQTPATFSVPLLQDVIKILFEKQCMTIVQWLITTFSKNELFETTLTQLVANKNTFEQNITLLAFIKKHHGNAKFAEKDLNAGVKFALAYGVTNMDAIKDLLALGADPSFIFNEVMQILASKTIAPDFLVDVVEHLFKLPQVKLTVSQEMMQIAGRLRKERLLRVLLKNGGNRIDALMPAINECEAKNSKQQTKLVSVFTLLFTSSPVSREVKDQKTSTVAQQVNQTASDQQETNQQETNQRDHKAGDQEISSDTFNTQLLTRAMQRAFALSYMDIVALLLTSFPKNQDLLNAALTGLVRDVGVFGENLSLLALIKNQWTSVSPKLETLDVKNLEKAFGYALDWENKDAVKQLLALGANTQFTLDKVMVDLEQAQQKIRTTRIDFLNKVLQLLLATTGKLQISDKAMEIVGKSHDEKLLKSFVERGGNGAAALMPILKSFKGQEDKTCEDVLNLLKSVCPKNSVNSAVQDAKEQKEKLTKEQKEKFTQELLTQAFNFLFEAGWNIQILLFFLETFPELRGVANPDDLISTYNERHLAKSNDAASHVVISKEAGRSHFERLYLALQFPFTVNDKDQKAREISKAEHVNKFFLTFASAGIMALSRFYLVEQKADVNSAGPDGNTALHFMCAIAAQSTLIEYKSNTHYETRDDAKGMLKTLLTEQKIIVDAKNATGLTPLMLIAEGREAEQEHVQLLCNAGANPLAKNKWGQTALSIAFKNPTRGVELVKAIFIHGFKIHKPTIQDLIDFLKLIITKAAADSVEPMQEPKDIFKFVLTSQIFTHLVYEIGGWDAVLYSKNDFNIETYFKMSRSGAWTKEFIQILQDAKTRYQQYSPELKQEQDRISPLANFLAGEIKAERLAAEGKLVPKYLTKIAAGINQEFGSEEDLDPEDAAGGTLLGQQRTDGWDTSAYSRDAKEVKGTTATAPKEVKGTTASKEVKRRVVHDVKTTKSESLTDKERALLEAVQGLIPEVEPWNDNVLKELKGLYDKNFANSDTYAYQDSCENAEKIVQLVEALLRSPPHDKLNMQLIAYALAVVIITEISRPLRLRTGSFEDLWKISKAFLDLIGKQRILDIVLTAVNSKDKRSIPHYFVTDQFTGTHKNVDDIQQEIRKWLLATAFRYGQVELIGRENFKNSDKVKPGLLEMLHYLASKWAGGTSDPDNLSKSTWVCVELLKTILGKNEQSKNANIVHILLVGAQLTSRRGQSKTFSNMCKALLELGEQASSPSAVRESKAGGNSATQSTVRESKVGGNSSQSTVVEYKADANSFTQSQSDQILATLKAQYDKAIGYLKARHPDFEKRLQGYIERKVALMVAAPTKKLAPKDDAKGLDSNDAKDHKHGTGSDSESKQRPAAATLLSGGFNQLLSGASALLARVSTSGAATQGANSSAMSPSSGASAAENGTGFVGVTVTSTSASSSASANTRLPTESLSQSQPVERTGSSAVSTTAGSSVQQQQQRPS